MRPFWRFLRYALGVHTRSPPIQEDARFQAMEEGTRQLHAVAARGSREMRKLVAQLGEMETALRR